MIQVASGVDRAPDSAAQSLLRVVEQQIEHTSDLIRLNTRVQLLLGEIRMIEEVQQGLLGEGSTGISSALKAQLQSLGRNLDLYL